MISTSGVGRGCRGVASIALATTLIAVPGIAVGSGPDVATDVAVKAAFLYNFAKFTEWPALPADAPIITCIVGDDRIAGAFVETVRGRRVSGHAFDVSRPEDLARWKVCNLLFVADAATGQFADRLSGIMRLPILTVSDARGFAQTTGIIELYVDDGRMRFAINVDAVERSGLRLSSRLLGLARIIRNGPH